MSDLIFDIDSEFTNFQNIIKTSFETFNLFDINICLNNIKRLIIEHISDVYENATENVAENNTTPDDINNNIKNIIDAYIDIERLYNEVKDFKNKLDNFKNNIIKKSNDLNIYIENLI